MARDVRRALPDDFATVCINLPYVELYRHYHTSKANITLWLAEMPADVIADRNAAMMLRRQAASAHPRIHQPAGKPPKLSAAEWSNAAFLAACANLKPVADVRVKAEPQWYRRPEPALTGNAFS